MAGWLDPLIGQQGPPGSAGPAGPTGPQGPSGGSLSYANLAALEAAVTTSFVPLQPAGVVTLNRVYRLFPTASTSLVDGYNVVLANNGGVWIGD